MALQCSKKPCLKTLQNCLKFSYSYYKKDTNADSELLIEVPILAGT